MVDANRLNCDSEEAETVHVLFLSRSMVDPEMITVLRS